MPKLRSLSVLVALALAVSGCGAAKKSSPDTSKKFKITLIKGVNGDPFYATMACGAQTTAGKLGANLSVVGGDKWGADTQTPVVNSVIAVHPDAVLIAPNDTTAMQAPLRQLVAAGIKLVIVDTGLQDVSEAVSIIDAVNAGGCNLADDELGKQVGGKCSMFVMHVHSGISTTDASAKRFLDEMHANFPMITVLPT